MQIFRSTGEFDWRGLVLFLVCGIWILVLARVVSLRDNEALKRERDDGVRFRGIARTVK